MQACCVLPQPTFVLPPSDINKMKAKLALIDKLMNVIEKGGATSITITYIKNAMAVIDKIILSLDNSNVKSLASLGGRTATTKAATTTFSPMNSLPSLGGRTATTKAATTTFSPPVFSPWNSLPSLGGRTATTKAATTKSPSMVPSVAPLRYPPQANSMATTLPTFVTVGSAHLQNVMPMQGRLKGQQVICFSNGQPQLLTIPTVTQQLAPATAAPLAPLAPAMAAPLATAPAYSLDPLAPATAAPLATATAAFDAALATTKAAPPSTIQLLGGEQQAQIKAFAGMKGLQKEMTKYRHELNKEKERELENLQRDMAEEHKLALTKKEEEHKKIIASMRLEHQQALEKLKSSTIAESQVSFNEALNSVIRKKDLVIKDLQSDITALDKQIYLLKCEEELRHLDFLLKNTDIVNKNII